MAQELAFRTPRAEEMTEVAIGMGTAGVTGLAQGVIIRFSPGLGALEPVFTWGTLLGVPAVGAIGALFTNGMIANVFKGIAAGGSAVLGYSLPALVAPFLPTGRSANRQLSPTRQQLPPGRRTERSYQEEFEAVAPHAF